MICLEGDVNCYIPIGLVDPETTTGDQTVKCWKNWCFVVDEPFTFTEPNDNNDTNTTKNETLCFNEVDCFIVVEIQEKDMTLDGVRHSKLDSIRHVSVHVHDSESR